MYLVRKPRGDAKDTRVFVVVSRSEVLDAAYSTAICAPVYSAREGLASQVEVGPEDGLKHDSAIHCDALASVPKRMLTDYIGSLSPAKVGRLDAALRVALDLD